MLYWEMKKQFLNWCLLCRKIYALMDQLEIHWSQRKIFEFPENHTEFPNWDFWLLLSSQESPLLVNIRRVHLQWQHCSQHRRHHSNRAAFLKTFTTHTQNYILQHVVNYYFYCVLSIALISDLYGGRCPAIQTSKYSNGIINWFRLGEPQEI